MAKTLSLFTFREQTLEKLNPILAALEQQSIHFGLRWDQNCPLIAKSQKDMVLRQKQYVSIILYQILLMISVSISTVILLFDLKVIATKGFSTVS